MDDAARLPYRSVTEMAQEPEPARRIPSWVWTGLVVALAFFFTVPLYFFLSRGLSTIYKQGKPLGRVADFYLTESSGKTLRRADLIGRVWVADFIFTRCQGPCPIMSGKMAELQRKLPSEVSFVSFSVDPEFDTPEVLRKYGQKYGAERGRWHLVTAKRSTIYEAIRKNFNLPGQGPDDEGGIVHSDRFVLVDRQGAIRGYYDGTDDGDVALLEKDAAELLR